MKTVDSRDVLPKTIGSSSIGSTVYSQPGDNGGFDYLLYLIDNHTLQV